MKVIIFLLLQKLKAQISTSTFTIHFITFIIISPRISSL